jgi:hypothetical protein
MTHNETQSIKKLLLLGFERNLNSDNKLVGHYNFIYTKNQNKF